MAYVYLLYTYGEYGPENTMATLDRSKLKDLCVQLLPYKEYSEDIEKFMNATDETILSEYNSEFQLGKGWGSPTIQIVELDKVIPLWK